MLALRLYSNLSSPVIHSARNRSDWMISIGAKFNIRSEDYVKWAKQYKGSFDITMNFKSREHKEDIIWIALQTRKSLRIQLHKGQQCLTIPFLKLFGDQSIIKCINLPNLSYGQMEWIQRFFGHNCHKLIKGRRRLQ